jgi:hypothetical protein
VTETSEFLFIFACATRIGQSLVDGPAEIKVKDGSIDPALLFDLLNCKQNESRIVFASDGVNNTKDWDPAKNGVDRPGVSFIAPYPDPQQSSLTQFDSKQESLFALELAKIIKCDPQINGKDLVAAVNKELVPFGMKLFLAAYPPAIATELSFVA